MLVRWDPCSKSIRHVHARRPASSHSDTCTTSSVCRRLAPVEEPSAPGMQLATGGACAEIFCAYGSMICVHVVSVVAIHSLPVELSMSVSANFQIMTAAGTARSA